jgi:uncharacterized membrane protein (DUF106 family)
VSDKVYFLEPAAGIAVVTVLLAAFSKILQRKMIDKEKMKAHQQEMKDIQKKWKELLKEADKNKKEIDELQTKMLSGQTQMMNSTMKMSLFTLPAFFVAMWLLAQWYGQQLIASPIPVIQFTGWIPQGLTMTPGYYEAYFSYYIIATVVFLIVERIYDLIKKKRKNAAVKVEVKNDIKIEEKKADAVEEKK